MTESQIRRALIAYIGDLPEGRGASYLTEFCVENFTRRADLVVANGHLSAFEIKSARDNLSRLSGQVESYLSHFERTTIVCAPKHADHIAQTVPRGVGLWVMTDCGVVRRRNSAKRTISRNAWLSFLPVHELRSLLRCSKISSRGDRLSLALLAQNIPVSAIRSFTLAYLKRRDVAPRKTRQPRHSEDQSRDCATQLFAQSVPGALKAIPRLL